MLDDSNKRIRIIWIDDEYRVCSFIELDKTTSMPKEMKIKVLEDMLNDNEVVTIPEPYCTYHEEDMISDLYKSKRDNAWSVVEYIWMNNKSKVLYKKTRNEIINEACKRFCINQKQVSRILSRYWQRGMTRNALLPEFDNCGGKGKVKKAGSVKRGRKVVYTREDYGEGINIDEQNLRIIKAAIKLFYMKKDRKPVKEAYNNMIKKFYSEKSIVDGKQKYLVFDNSKVPTYRQFYYWLKKDEDIKGNYISRYGKKEFDLLMRELLHNSTNETFGPGSKYQIDATIADVYIVSSLNRNRLIGRPIVYIVIDVYSRLIVGMYAGLEGPSWIGAMMALDNVVEDKVEFCKKYGIEITEDEWPNSCLPESILADRGEFEGYNPENLINNLGVIVYNAPPYRGDLKGVVERYFRTMNGKIKHMVPGAVLKEFKERGDRDSRYDAVLDLKEFTTLIINSIIHHNKSMIKKYPKELGLLIDNIRACPVDIWSWGIKNRACGFRIWDRDITRLNLLYKDIATITREGIKLHGVLGKLFYSCEEALKEQWFIKRKSEKINIAYDPRNMGQIYIPLNKGKEYINCELLDKCFAYKGLNHEEIVFQHELDQEMIASNQNKQNQIDVDYLVNADTVIKEAIEKTEKQLEGSDRSRIKDIKDIRTIEKDTIRDDEAFLLDEVHTEMNKVSEETKLQIQKQSINVSLVKQVIGERNG